MPSKEKLRQKKIDNLQYAALTLIKQIDKKLGDEHAEKEGVFRVSAYTDPQRKAIVAEIEQGTFKFSELTLLQQAQILKSILGSLQNHNHSLFSSTQFETLNSAKKKDDYHETIKYILKETSEATQKIAFCLLTMLNKVAKNQKTRMPASNLGTVIGPNLFPMIDTMVEDSINTFKKQNEICCDLITNAPSFPPLKLTLLGTHYEAQIKNISENRTHFFKLTGDRLGDAYKGFEGDLLKSRILLNFKKQLENATLENLDDEVAKLIDKPEYNVLATSQGLATWIFGRETSSVKAFREMVAERRSDLEFDSALKMK
ncbi:RhoGAP domain-containing protein [Legionella sp. WA2022007384]